MAAVTLPTPIAAAWRAIVRVWLIAQLVSLAVAGLVFVVVILEPDLLAEVSLWKRVPYVTAPAWPSLARQNWRELNGQSAKRGVVGWKPSRIDRFEVNARRHTHTMVFIGLLFTIATFLTSL